MTAITLHSWANITEYSQRKWTQNNYTCTKIVMITEPSLDRKPIKTQIWQLTYLSAGEAGASIHLSLWTIRSLCQTTQLIKSLCGLECNPSNPLVSVSMAQEDQILEDFLGHPEPWRLGTSRKANYHKGFCWPLVTRSNVFMRWNSAGRTATSQQAVQAVLQCQVRAPLNLLPHSEKTCILMSKENVDTYSCKS